MHLLKEILKKLKLKKNTILFKSINHSKIMNYFHWINNKNVQEKDLIHLDSIKENHLNINRISMFLYLITVNLN
jgi:hypothetical protein